VSSQRIVKEWIENRLEELAEIFAIGIGGFSVMDNGEISRKAAKSQKERRTKRKVSSKRPGRDEIS
jgi:hypothetical protein